MLSVESLLSKYEEAKNLRSPKESDWRLAAAYCMPKQYNAWGTDGPSRFTGSTPAAARRIAYDTTGVRSLFKYVAILTRMATPKSQRWHSLEASDPALMKDREVAEYFDTLTNLLFKMRYDPKAGFEQAAASVYKSLGTYGTAPIYIGARPRSTLDMTGGFFYKACALRDIFILTNENDQPAIIFRRIWLNARQFREKFPEATPPGRIASELGKESPSETDFVEFVHVVGAKHPDQYNPKALDERRHPVFGYYVGVEDRQIIAESGFQGIPYLTPRVGVEAGEVYGFGPAQQAIPAMGSASAVKKSYLKQGQRAADQVLLAHDDAVTGGRVDLNPGSLNYGTVTADGRPLVHALQPGQFQPAENILMDERRDIEDSFFVTLFQILTEKQEMTATEVMERVSEKVSLLAPTMAQLHSEWLGPCIEREIQILTEIGKLPNPPEALVQAEGDYNIVYSSPMAKGQQAEEIGGFLRVLEIAMQASQALGTPAPLDHIDFDKALPEVAHQLAVPERWLRSEQEVEMIREGRAEEIDEQKQIEMAPATASVIKTMSDAQRNAA